MKNHKYIKVKILDLQGGASAPPPPPPPESNTEQSFFSLNTIQKFGSFVRETAGQGLNQLKEKIESESESEEDGEGIITKDPKIFESILLKLIPIIMNTMPKVKSKEEFQKFGNDIVKIGLLELNKLEDKTPKKEVETSIDITEE